MLKTAILLSALACCIVLAIPAAYAAHSTMMGFQGRITNATGNAVTSGSLKVNISTGTSCNGELFNTTYVNNFSSDGIFDIMLGENGDLALDYNRDYYLCIFVKGEQLGGPYVFRGGQGEIGPEDVNFSSSITLGEQIAFSLGQIIRNVVNGWLDMVGSLNITGNLLVRGNATFMGNLSVSGNLTIGDNICNATSCFSLSQLNGTQDLAGYMRFSEWNSTNETYMTYLRWNATNESYDQLLRTAMLYATWNATNASYAVLGSDANFNNLLVEGNLMVRNTTIIENATYIYNETISVGNVTAPWFLGLWGGSSDLNNSMANYVNGENTRFNDSVTSAYWQRVLDVNTTALNAYWQRILDVNATVPTNYMPYSSWNSTNASYVSWIYLNQTNSSYVTWDKNNQTNTSYMTYDRWNSTNATYEAYPSFWNQTNESYVTWARWNITNATYDALLRTAMLYSVWNSTNATYDQLLKTAMLYSAWNSTNTTYDLIYNMTVNGTITNNLSYVTWSRWNLTNASYDDLLRTAMLYSTWNSTNATYDAWRTTKMDYSAWNSTNTTYALNTTLATMAWNQTNETYVQWVYLNGSYMLYSAWNTTNTTYALNTTLATMAWNQTNASYALNTSLATVAWNQTNISYTTWGSWFNQTNTTYPAINATGWLNQFGFNGSWGQFQSLGVSGNAAIDGQMAVGTSISPSYAVFFSKTSSSIYSALFASMNYNGVAQSSYGAYFQSYGRSTNANPRSYGARFEAINYRMADSTGLAQTIGGDFRARDDADVYGTVGGSYEFIGGEFSVTASQGDWTTNNPAVTNYGILIDAAPVGYGSNSKFYAIYSAGGQSVHAGNLRIGSVAVPTTALDVTGNANISGHVKAVNYTFNGAGAWTIQNETGGNLTFWNSTSKPTFCIDQSGSMWVEGCSRKV